MNREFMLFTSRKILCYNIRALTKGVINGHA